MFFGNVGKLPEYAINENVTAANLLRNLMVVTRVNCIAFLFIFSKKNVLIQWYFSWVCFLIVRAYRKYCHHVVEVLRSKTF
jgi:hypothetical protein